MFNKICCKKARVVKPACIFCRWLAEQALGEGRGAAGVPGLPGQLLLGRHLPTGGIGEETPF